MKKVFDNKATVKELAEIIGIDETIRLLRNNAASRHGSLTSSDVWMIYDEEYSDRLASFSVVEKVCDIPINYYNSFIIDYLRENEPRRPLAILDFGCGSGALDLALGYMGFHVHGTDYDAIAIKKANEKKVLLDSVPVEFKVAHDLSVIEGRYDYALLSDVVEHLGEEELLKVLRGIHGLLKDGGRILIHTPNGNVDPQVSRGLYKVLNGALRCLEQASSRYLKRHHHDEEDLMHEYYQQTHINVMPPRTIKGLLRRIGFNDIEFTYRFDRPIPLASVLARLGISTDMGIVAQKSHV